MRLLCSLGHNSLRREALGLLRRALELHKTHNPSGRGVIISQNYVTFVNCLFVTPHDCQARSLVVAQVAIEELSDPVDARQVFEQRHLAGGLIVATVALDDGSVPEDHCLGAIV